MKVKRPRLIVEVTRRDFRDLKQHSGKAMSQDKTEIHSSRELASPLSPKYVMHVGMTSPMTQQNKF